ncbi:hypothetical protein CCHR01_02966 [Colletotrichum chrysophilum]|uniref:Uncharacterized protein n=1 Tax=Colletotrichum chrysophilum TaxID=1836956 RepID=A0AAD9AW45_9PEZI|nr:hypothetical protein CCHR01_02966 [Colletotrichum chrysophilum]
MFRHLCLHSKIREDGRMVARTSAKKPVLISVSAVCLWTKIKFLHVLHTKLDNLAQLGVARISIVIGINCLTHASTPQRWAKSVRSPWGKSGESRVDTSFHRIIASAGLPLKARWRLMTPPRMAVDRA